MGINWWSLLIGLILGWLVLPHVSTWVRARTSSLTAA